MATTTPNFGWPVPTSSDLVKNGATAIEALGDGIDASLLDLKGGTSGQVLKKNSNTDMDFVWGAGGGGKVLQLLQTTYATTTSSSSTTYADSGLTGTITPSASGSKVMVIVSIPIKKSASNSANGIQLNIVRGATQIVEIGHINLYTGTAIDGIAIATYNYLDSPATTSATTYKVQFKNFNASAAVEVCPGDKTATMILMEIGA
jgi:hypothetical protein